MLELLHSLCWKCEGGGVVNVGTLVSYSAAVSLQKVDLAECVSQIPFLVSCVQFVFLEMEEHSLQPI